ncbi:hypothetical protein MMC30_003146 [Trapelia coarctata]|nr:hypothetical protein [Trapelia coarctata]
MDQNTAVLGRASVEHNRKQIRKKAVICAKNRSPSRCWTFSEESNYRLAWNPTDCEPCCPVATPPHGVQDPLVETPVTTNANIGWTKDVDFSEAEPASEDLDPDIRLGFPIESYVEEDYGLRISAADKGKSVAAASLEKFIAVAA